MKIEFNSKKNFDYLVEFVSEKSVNKKDKEYAKLFGFEFEEASVLNIASSNKIIVNINDLKDLENYKIGMAKAYKCLEKSALKTINIQAPKNALEAVLEGLMLGAYSFTKYLSTPPKITEKSFNFSCDKLEQKSLEQVIAVCESVNLVRDIVNSIPDEIYPKTFADMALKLTKNTDIKAKILDETELKKQNMTAMLAVNRASRHEARLVHLSYTPKGAKKKVALVGKGLTYDSGGLSLKPSEYMVSMKCDKSGASAVLGAILAASKLDLKVEIHAILGLAENMIGGDAYKPDDVLVSRSKKTIEVKNTDAEGRLVLADCLDYSQDLAPDFLLDLATLTGACVAGLGEYTIGVMGHSQSLKDKIKTASIKSGELTADLPFNRYLKPLIKSEIADVCNISSSRYGGAITAGLFLDNFIKEANKDKWIHLDIAGPAYVEKPWGYNPYGATGAGVRLLIEFLKTL